MSFTTLTLLNREIAALVEPGHLLSVYFGMGTDARADADLAETWYGVQQADCFHDLWELLPSLVPVDEINLTSFKNRTDSAVQCELLKKQGAAWSLTIGEQYGRVFKGDFLFLCNFTDTVLQITNTRDTKADDSSLKYLEVGSAARFLFKDVLEKDPQWAPMYQDLLKIKFIQQGGLV